MRVFKFGGASVKDANAVKNVVKVLREVGYDNTLLVVSAMGKTTNAMEDIINAYFNDKQEIPAKVSELVDYHHAIVSELFPNASHTIYKEIKVLIDEINGFLVWNKSPNYNFVYDQIVGYGELLSTTIISAYLKEIGIANQWLDVRNYIKTDSSYRDTTVDWERTQKNVTNIDKKVLNITQGFLGSDDNNFTTTLGREGSDYTAAILAYCLNADSVTIWKDVPGVLNADPRYFEETQLLNNISYREAIELAFYGASVIHPKTLQPLQRKEIPLHVKSFVNPKDKGTTVGKGVGIEPKVPCFIVKKNQVLMKLSSLDFSFIVEDSISELFKLFHQHKIKVDLIQNSAISFSVCIDNKFGGLAALLQQLKSKFKVVHHENVSLYTIRHFDNKALETLQNGHELLLEQRGTETVQLVVK
ncbi:MAG: aspartate kinase [Maribacter dokdonensis]|uniref:Aspartokinase n=1 Tax=Maribacter dokdonensis TaxID=320912 RepID=A0A1H4M4D3_9FLAO|nr:MULTISPECIES: aspartate kinase [Maribacter]APA64636.1 aspartate kinase [Maribacter sp. 1_2014MBL_MicDiv]KSA15279.1 Aspartokinase [Maribacter dokdonensis DSW-8]MBU2903032.1 aspartate kinase [Maribacter dokdonensis]CAG2534536.1 aspartate kinase [Maribacter dokdonensis]SEB77272.1 aspartate kinase [Maribacter dokdonensis]|tara:strand:- start:1592 stop:2839 length:1248 start_codon:yes stop_codon:yes gene_type:complete